MINETNLINYDNLIVWVCHTNWEKRVIKPTPVVLKWIILNYSSGYPEFYKLNKNGSISKTKIPYMNKGRVRMFEQTPLKVFDNEMECKSYFTRQCDGQIKYYTNLKNEIK